MTLIGSEIGDIRHHPPPGTATEQDVIEIHDFFQNPGETGEGEST